MNRKNSFGSFVPWETFFVTEHAASGLRDKDISNFVPCHIQEATWTAGRQKARRRNSNQVDAVGSNPSSSEDNRNKQHEDLDSADAVKKHSLRLHRRRLEYDVFRLEQRLQEEAELHAALANGHEHAIDVISNIPTHLPISAQKLLLDVAVLEFAVSKLQHQMVALHCQLLRERSEYEVGPSNADGGDAHYEVEPSNADVGDVHSEHEDLPRSHDTESSCSSPTSQNSSHHKPFISCQPPSPSTPAQEGTQRNVHHDSSSMSTGTNPDTECSLRYQSNSTSFDVNSYTDIEADVEWRLRDEEQTVSSFECGKQQHAEDSDNKQVAISLRNSDSSLELQIDSIPHSLTPEWSTNPNNLSEQMVQCMMDIYHYLSDHHRLRDISSPNSPFGHHLASSSLSSVSESSLLSFARSPLIDLRTKDLKGEYDHAYDPYPMEDKMQLPDIGPYKTAVEVSWLSVGQKQLDYAAEALQRFKTFVDSLSRVDPSSMRHMEKLAFWINVYNALMMHACLAYGTPDNEAKFFLLMQKASYVVGGHSFNAITIEYAFLKSRVSTYRPQLELLLALKEIKLTERQRKFGITYAEPLTLFALSFGAWSSPAVRVYKSENINEQLEESMRDYLHAAVGLSIRNRNLMVPKLLYVHARDDGDNGISLYDWICRQLSKSQLALVQHRKRPSQVQILPFDFRFRYLFV